MKTEAILRNNNVQKCEKLKEEIDGSLVRDPLEKLAKKMQSNNSKFELKPITQAKLRKVMKKM